MIALLPDLIRLTWRLLPPAMASEDAVRMLVAIAWQESRARLRRQVGGGPARGLWQMEPTAVTLLYRHPTIGPIAREVAARCGYVSRERVAVAVAIEHHDLLAAALARLLLWALPEPLPLREDMDRAWAQYLRVWRPGTPRPETWPEAWAEACARVP